MALKLKPPTYAADAPGIFISQHDTAWDNALYLADMKALQTRALAELQAAVEAEHVAKNPGATAEEIAALRAGCKLSEAHNAEAIRQHPVVRYMRGETRWQPDAPDVDPEGKPCTVRGRYLKPGATEFKIRRLKPEVYHLADATGNSALRLTAFASASLRGVQSVGWTWTAEESETRAPEHVMRALHNFDVSLPLEIGLAVISLCRTPDDVETFR